MGSDLTITHIPFTQLQKASARTYTPPPLPPQTSSRYPSLLPTLYTHLSVWGGCPKLCVHDCLSVCLYMSVCECLSVCLSASMHVTIMSVCGFSYVRVYHTGITYSLYPSMLTVSNHSLQQSASGPPLDCFQEREKHRHFITTCLWTTGAQQRNQEKESERVKWLPLFHMVQTPRKITHSSMPGKITLTAIEYSTHDS